MQFRALSMSGDGWPYPKVWQGYGRGGARHGRMDGASGGGAFPRELSPAGRGPRPLGPLRGGIFGPGGRGHFVNPNFGDRRLPNVAIDRPRPLYDSPAERLRPLHPPPPPPPPQDASRFRPAGYDRGVSDADRYRYGPGDPDRGRSNYGSDGRYPDSASRLGRYGSGEPPASTHPTLYIHNYH